MIKIIVDTEEEKQMLIAESRYIHNFQYRKGRQTLCLDQDKARVLMHIYAADIIEVKYPLTAFEAWRQTLKLSEIIENSVMLVRKSIHRGCISRLSICTDAYGQMLPRYAEIAATVFTPDVLKKVEELCLKHPGEFLMLKVPSGTL
jgi:hypothetical protein